MDLYYITNNRIPTEKAHGLQIANMCSAFASDDNTQVELIVPYRKTPIKEDIFDYYSIDENFKVRYVRTFLPTYYGLFNKLIFWVRRFIFLFRIFFINFSDESVVYTRQPDIAAILKLKGLTSVYEDHGWPDSKVWLYKFLVGKIDKVVAITEGIKEKYKEEGIDTPKVLVAHDGVEIEKFDINISKKEARKKTNLPQDKQIALYTGSFLRYDWKGVDLILKAAQEMGNIYFVLVGGKEEELKKINKEYSTDNLIVESHKPHEEIPLYLKAADLLLLPNKSSKIKSQKYTSPIKLFEYMASGRPILSSDIPALKEVLDKGNSFMFRAGDLEDFKKKIKKVFEKSGLAKQKAVQARKKVNEYSWKRRSEKILNFITQ